MRRILVAIGITCVVAITCAHAQPWHWREEGPAYWHVVNTCKADWRCRWRVYRVFGITEI